MIGREIITAHAVVRWLERVDGIDLDPLRRRLGPAMSGDVELIAAADVMMGIDIAAVRRRMATPAVRTACGCGASGVRCAGVRLVIRDGVVVSVMVTEIEHRFFRSRFKAMHGRRAPRRQQMPLAAAE